MPRVKTVDEYINQPEEWKALLTDLRSIVLETELNETIKWGAPVYTLDNKNVVGLGAFTHHAGLWFFQGVFLDDPEKRLVNAQEGKTKALRQLRFEKNEEINADEIRFFIDQAIENQKAGKELKVEMNQEFEIPDLLQESLDENAELYVAFQALSHRKQREYALYIQEAKRESTKKRRMEKIEPMILAGKGLNDKYRTS